MKITIQNRWTGRAIFDCEVSAEVESMGYRLALGFAVKAAIKSGAEWIPTIANIHKTVYEAASRPGSLEMSRWHTCDTTHCRAGWVVTLAGDGGRVLEGLMGTAAAAALIYQASDPGLERVPDFYASNEDALADMKRLADLEAAKP